MTSATLPQAALPELPLPERVWPTAVRVRTHCPRCTWVMPLGPGVATRWCPCGWRLADGD
jgi:hypothetical protein